MLLVSRLVVSAVAVQVSEELTHVCVCVGDSCSSGMHEISFATGSGGWYVCAAFFLLSLRNTY